MAMMTLHDIDNSSTVSMNFVMKKSVKIHCQVPI